MMLRMHIDEIRRLSAQYAAGNPPKQRAPKAIRTKYRKKRRFKIDTHALAVYLAKSSTVAIRNRKLDEMGLRYREYIQTPHWKTFRENYILNLLAFRAKRTEDRPDKCEISFCKNTGTTLHHRSYDNLGNETFDDVFLVCQECHERIHKEVKRIQRSRSGNHISTSFPKQDELPVYENIPKEHLPWGGLFARR